MRVHIVSATAAGTPLLHAMNGELTETNEPVLCEEVLKSGQEANDQQGILVNVRTIGGIQSAGLGPAEFLAVLLPRRRYKPFP